VEVRRLGGDESDLALDALRLLTVPDGYPTPTPEYLLRFLSRPDNVLIVAMDGVPVGFLLAYLLDRADRDQQMMFLYEVGVAESHRRRGIGTHMITQLKAICWTQNVMKMWVPTGRSNVAATGLYASTGATPLLSGDEAPSERRRDGGKPHRLTVERSGRGEPDGCRKSPSSGRSPGRGAPWLPSSRRSTSRVGTREGVREEGRGVLEPERSFLLDVRRGKVSEQECLTRAGELEQELSDLASTSPLPDEPDEVRVEEWVHDVYRRRWGVTA